jgi:hypothetical protein
LSSKALNEEVLAARGIVREAEGKSADLLAAFRIYNRLMRRTNE